MQDQGILRESQRRIAPLGLDVTPDIEVTHVVRILADREDQIRALVVRRITMSVAITNPCQAFRPGGVMAFDDPMAPQSMRRLVEITGAEVAPYGGEDECCGATLFLADPRLSIAAGRRKLAATEDAEVLVHSCGNCHLLLRHLQNRILADDPGLRKRALFLPQLIGLSMGLPELELGLREGALGSSR
jgi:heterodisulfide reductase subunit B